MLKYCAHRYVTLYWQRDFVVVIKVDLQLASEASLGYQVSPINAVSGILRAKLAQIIQVGPMQSRESLKAGRGEVRESAVEQVREQNGNFHAFAGFEDSRTMRRKQTTSETKNELLQEYDHTQ